MLIFVYYLVFLVLYPDFGQSRHLERKEEKHSLHHSMGKAELKRYFGTTFLDEVPEYEITHPILSNENGDIQSDEIARLQADSNIRQRRKTPEETTAPRYYKLKAFGKDLKLKLRRSKVLGPRFVVEDRHKNDIKRISTSEMNEHFIGNVISHPGSHVSLSAGNGLTGMIKLPEETFHLQPLTENLSQRFKRSASPYPHILVRANNNEKALPCDVEDDLGDGTVEHRSTIIDPPKLNNSHKYLQTIYVVDHHLREAYGQSTLEKLLPTLANMVAGLYRDHSFGKIKLNYILNKIIFLNRSELSYPKNATTSTKLSHIQKWAAENNAEYDEDPDHFDTVTLLSRGELKGRGVLGSICTSRSTANVVNLGGLNSASTIAHEVFHNIGYYHDGSEKCPNHKYIMSTVVSSGPASYTWSACSRDYVQSFLSSEASLCLDDPPFPGIQRPTEPSAVVIQSSMRLPGVVYDANKQCEYVYSSLYKNCPTKQNQCESLFCTADNKVCHTNYAPPLEGTRCGVRHWCIRGECVDDGSIFVDGKWGAWSNYSDCTKDCDIGVAHQTRECNNPSPQNGGQNCEGNVRGNHKTCNTQECPEDEVSFRQKQCSAKGKYSEYIVRSDPCSLVCRTGSSIYWMGTTIDGTKCSNQKGNLDVCIEGHCKDVGCDYNLGSGRRLDRCKVCGGDGSSCALNIFNYTKAYRGYGYEKADVMVTLPVHSTNVVAVQKDISYNMIGIQNIEGEYMIQPPSWSKTIEAAGTTITYIHEDNKYADRIYIPGPIKYELNLVFIFLYEANQLGVDISYYAPTVGLTSNVTDFEWTVSVWSTCSRSCAGGLSVRSVRCVRKDDKTDVGYENCDGITTPAAIQSCNTQPCPPEWYISAWETCSLSCGKGFQQRSVVCRQKMAENDWRTVSNETLCLETKPVVSPTERNCNKINCPPEYVAGQWSKCSTTCSPGVMTRKLSCQRRTATGTTELLPELRCQEYGSMKLSTTQECNTDSPCEPPPQYEIGCFQLDEEIFPSILANFKETLDYENILETARSCAKLAFHQNKRYFGLANEGECRVGPDDVQANIFKPKTSSQCSSSVGKTGAIYLYTLDQMPSFTPMGCYEDSYYERAMPVLYKNFRDQINWYLMERTVNQCARVAYHSGYEYFGVQFYGECWSGVTANETYDKYGESDSCWKGVGKHFANFVYKLN
ncbi:A disintegrin and metalloproteinase with thrombospondin motifs 18-like [Dendronephthya gigantea]|uniref:A disintegrin and metalloproteinase with thrombospondin motifs 18-like n=1 Tax=Dendronephthya gigantea TaxID=151771 RepID=UPI001069402C|nr:A disintegrin and metalloproteinase with thrombospondin motifs 18-like [Dendronephthya gigantea]